MAHDDTIVTIIRETQRRIGRIAEKRGITLKAIGLDADIPYSTVRSYFGQDANAQPHEMPLSAFYKLVGVLPDDLLSLLLPEGKSIADAHSDDINETIDLAIAALEKLRGRAV